MNEVDGKAQLEAHSDESVCVMRSKLYVDSSGSVWAPEEIILQEIYGTAAWVNL